MRLPETPSTTFYVQDIHGAEIKLSSTVTATGTEHGTVTKITEPDIDYNDTIQGPSRSNPVITVDFGNTTEEFTTSFGGTTAYEDEEFYLCEDLEVVKPLWSTT